MAENGTILLVEDDAAIAQFLRRAVAAEGRYQLQWENTGTKAKAGLRQRRAQGSDPFLAVFLDLGLPDGDGLDLIPWFRREAPESIIMVLSARDQEPDKVEALQRGADDYLTKPFTLGELLARLQAHLRRLGRKSEQGPLRVGDWVLVDDRRCLRLGDREIPLTAKEYQLLRLLLRHAGAVLTHRQILVAIWGPSHAEDNHYVRIYIQRLREKIETDPNAPQHLVMKLGLGYHLLVADQSRSQS